MAQRVIFFTGLLLPASETFIRAQGEALSTFTPFYVGSRQVQGLTLPGDRTYTVNQGNIPGLAAEAAFKLTGYAPALYKKIQQLEPTLIHAHFGVNGTLALPLAKRLNLPLITTFYGLDSTLEKTLSWSSLTHHVYFQRQTALKREVHLFIAVSEFIRQKLISQGFSADKVITHYYGVDTRFFHPEPNASHRKPIVLFIGRLVEKKGCEYLIKAMANVQVDYPDVKLIIIGDGPLRPHLESLAKQLQLNHRFIGVQPPDICRQWMQTSKIMVVPSVTATDGDSEGLPTVLLEAQATGLPVVASTHAGIPEAITHGKNGFLTNERDWQSIASCISALLRSPNLRQYVSCQALEGVKTHFDLYRQTKGLEKLYQTVSSQ